MQNIDIRFNATSNFQKVHSDLASLTAQATALGTQLNMLGQAKPPALTNPATWRAASNAAEAASAAYRDAVSSSGKLLTQQIRQNSEATKFNDLLQKQDLTFGKMLKNRNIMRQAYQDQLRMQRMTATMWGTDKQGRSVIDITMPKEVPAELDTWRNKMGFFSAAVRSGSQEMINLGKNTQWAGRQLMVGFTMPMAMFGAATGMLAYQQDKLVTQTAKVYDTMATTAMGKEMELAKLREDQINQGIDLAQRYGSALEDTYNVQQQLAAQGYRGNQLMGMTDEVQRISALGDLDVDTAVNMTTALRTAFKDTIKDTKDLTQAFDYMNAVENATSLGIRDIAEAVPRAGSALASLGVTVEQMTTLMVAMKEAGVDPKEGANALKSATTRILSVVPAAEAMFQGQLKGFESVQEIADKAGGNLYDFLEMLAQATNGMDNLQKQKGIAKLFGTYQYNRLNAALRGITDAMFGMGSASSQTMKAIQIEAKGAADNASTAAEELARKQESLSGRFNAAWQKLRANLAQIGEPFLEIGIQILGWADKIAKWFTNLDAGVQKAIAWSGIISGAAAVFIMFGGLLLNFTGQIGNAIGALGGFFTRFKILDKAMAANNAITQEVEQSQREAASATQTLTEELNALSAAYREADLAAQAYVQGASMFTSQVGGDRPTSLYPTPMSDLHNIDSGPSSNIMPVPVTNKNGVVSYYTDAQGNRISKTDYEYATGVRDTSPVAVTDKNGRVNRYQDYQGNKISKAEYESQKKQLEVGKKLAGWQKDYEARKINLINLESQGLSNAKEQAAIAEKTAILAAQEAESTRIAAENEAKRGQARQRIANGALAAAGVAGAAATFTDGGLQTGLMTASGLAFGAQAALELKSAVDPDKNGVTKGLSLFSGKARAAATGMMTVFKTAFTAIRTGLSALMGPWGVAIAAVGFGIYKIWEKSQEGQRQQEEINKSADAWAEKLGLVEQKYKEINFEIASVRKGSKFVSEVEQLADIVRESDSLTAVSDEIKEGLDSGGESGDAKARAVALAEYIKITQQLNGSAKDAEQAIAALYIAAGQAPQEAIATAKSFVDEVAQMGSAIDVMTNSLSESFNQALSENENEFDERIDGMTDNFKTAFDSLGTWAEREQFVIDVGANIEESAMSEFKSKMSPLFNEIIEENNLDLGDLIRGFDLAQNSVAQDYYSETSDATKELAETLGVSANNAAYLGQLLSAQGTTTYNILNNSKEYVQSLAEELGIKTEIATLDELRETNEWQLAQVTRSNVQETISLKRQQWAQENKNLTPIQQAAASVGRVLWINQRLAKVGLPTINHEYQAINFALLGNLNFTNKAVDAEKRREQAAQATLDVFQQFDQIGARKTAMTSVMGAMQDAILGDVQAGQDAAMDGLENSLEARSNGLEAKGDRIANHFDNLAERIEKSFDRRIDAINKEIEAEQSADEIRQRIYERAMERINRMAESENRTIDFNVAIGEGNFDEAAKIFNEGMASDVTNTIEDQMERASERTERRVERLEKQIERLEKQKDARLKEVEAAREAAEKELEIQREKFQKMSEMKKENLADSHAQTKDQLQRELELVMAYIPRNKKEAVKYLNEMSEEYDTFGAAWKAGQIKYTDLMTREWKDQMKAAAMTLKSDIDWANAGYDSANAIMRGMAAAMGFNSVSKFRNWLGVEAAKPPPPASVQNNRKILEGSAPEFGSQGESRHGGGLIGEGGKGSRKGFAGSQSPHNERWINARKGEYVMQKSAVDRMGKNFMDRVNSGKEPLGGAGVQPFGHINAMVGNIMMDSLTKGLSRRVRKVARKGARAAVRKVMGQKLDNFSGTQGPGGSSRPINVAMTRGLHDTETAYPGIDFSAPTGTPIYAVGDGRITQSYDIPGYEPRAAHGGNGYKSYGRVMVLGLNSGGSVLYAHLSQRGFAAGAKVKGGSVIGRSGDTGYSTGPHLHFGASNRNPTAYLRSGAILKQDGALYAHKDEAVISASRTKALYEAIDQFNKIMYNPEVGRRSYKSVEDKVVSSARNENIANNYNAVYNVEVKDIPQHIDKEELANLVVKKIEEKKTNVGRSRRVGNR